MFDFLKIIGKLSEIKDKSKEIKDRLRFTEIVYKSDSSNISVYATADKEFRKIEISEELLSGNDKDRLEKELVLAINATIKLCSEKSAEELKEGLKDHIPDIPGLDVEKLFS